MELGIEQIFQAADNNLNCNTAYPVFKREFQKYRTDADILCDTHALSYYIHIPFCQHLCAFCEYTRFQAGDLAQESHYIDMLEHQINEFLRSHRIERIYGLDIGGGTPTALGEKDFERVLILSQLLEEGYTNYPTPLKAQDYEKSIEVSLNTLSQNKIKLITQAGFRRVSMGVQSMNYTLLQQYGRDYQPVYEIAKWMDLFHTEGIDKINLDLMYGIPGQTEEAIQGTLLAMELLRPEQITLYEMRFNHVEIPHGQINRNLQVQQYQTFYDSLTAMGYHGRYGKNTFTLGDDKGVSSYLRYRMEDGIPYKGFGISAQSMGPHGLSYGSLKNTNETSLPAIDFIQNDSNYSLPPDEMAAKYVAIAMYNGCFQLDVLSRFLEEDARTYFAQELHFLLQRGLITIRNNQVFITESGFRYYGAVTALFWSSEQKRLLLMQERYA